MLKVKQTTIKRMQQLINSKNQKRGFSALLSFRNFSHVAEQVQHTVRKMSSASKVADLIHKREFTVQYSMQIWRERVKERKLALPLILALREISKKYLKKVFNSMKVQKL